jgi:hypothetical protein
MKLIVRFKTTLPETHKDGGETPGPDLWDSRVRSREFAPRRMGTVADSRRSGASEAKWLDSPEGVSFFSEYPQ